MTKANTKLPMEDWQTTMDFLENYDNDFNSGDMAGDDEEIGTGIKTALSFMKHIRKLYWKCAGCGRIVAPDEGYAECNEETYCLECSENGI